MIGRLAYSVTATGHYINQPAMNGSNDFQIQYQTFPEPPGSIPTTSEVNTIPQVSTMEKVLGLSVLLVIEIVSLVGNLSLWIVILGTPSLRTISNGLVLYMSASCLCIALVNSPMSAYFIIEGGENFAATACQVIGFVFATLFANSFFAFALISFNRYVLVCHPHKYQTVFSKTNIGSMMGGLALLSALLVLPAVMGWLGRIAYLPLQAVCCIDWGWSAAYSLFIMFTCAMGPISTMSYCYFKILQTVKHSNTKIRSTYTIQMSTVSTPNHEECSRYASGETPGISRNLRRKPDHAATTRVNIESITDEQPYKDCSKNRSGDTPGISRNLRRKHGHAATTRVNIESINEEKSYNDEYSRNESGETQGISRNLRRKQQSREKEELRLTLSFLVVIGVYFFTLLPNYMVIILSMFQSVSLPKAYAMIAIMMAYAYGAINPIIYLKMNKRYMEAFKRIFIEHKWWKID